MPEKLHRKLKQEASRKGFSGSQADRFIYGTMRKTGWKPKDDDRVGKTSIANAGKISSDALKRRLSKSK